MGTYDSSKIVRARRDTVCCRAVACREPVIPKGELYLRFKLGLKNDVVACLPCAVRYSWHYDCAALRTAMLGAP